MDRKNIEIWKPIIGQEGYQVSNLGRIKGYRGKIRSLHLDKSNGYVGQVLGNKKMVRAHRAVWEAFNGKIPNGMQINHKNGIKSDNRLENLELNTPKQNTIHALRSGLFQRNHIKKLFTEDEIRTIRFFGSLSSERINAGRVRPRRGFGITKILGKIYGVEIHVIQFILSRSSYNWVD